MTEIASIPLISGKSNTVPIVMICFLFFVFGCMTWANSTWIQFFKLSFSLTNTQSFLVTFSSYIAFFFLALPASLILKKLGFKNGIVFHHDHHLINWYHK